jgi:hypothetical protein
LLRRSGWAYVAAAVVLAAVAWRLRGSSGRRPPDRWWQVASEVRRPGAYRITEGARVLLPVARRPQVVQ